MKQSNIDYRMKRYTIDAFCSKDPWKGCSKKHSSKGHKHKSKKGKEKTKAKYYRGETGISKPKFKNNQWKNLLDIKDLPDYIPSVDKSSVRKNAEVLGWKIDSKHPYKLKKKNLTDTEIQSYRRIGKPNPKQNYLELFEGSITRDLFRCMEFGSDNYEKANHVIKLLKPYGFEELGEGTNIIVLKNYYYPGVVFKIALDSNGIADNFNDQILQYIIPRFARVYAVHHTGIVSVQEYYAKMTVERIQEFKDDINELLEALTSKYLVADLAICRHLNFGVGRDGKFVLIDGSDLFPLDQMDKKFECQHPIGWNEKKEKMIRCKGRLLYTADYLHLRCEKCGLEVNPLELRPKHEEEEQDAMDCTFDMTTKADRDFMEREEIAAIRERYGIRDDEVIASDDEIEFKKPDNFQYADNFKPIIDLEGIPSDVNTVEAPYKYYKYSEYLTEEIEHYHDTSEEPQDLVPEHLREEYEKNIDLVKKPQEEEEDDDEDDEEDGGFTLSMSPERKAKAESMREIFNQRLQELKKMAAEEDEDDEDEEEEEVTPPFEESEDKDEPEEEELDDGPGIDYSVIPIFPDEPERTDGGIYLNINGDFSEAWEKEGLPIYITFDNGKTQHLAIRSSTLKMILDKFISELIE